MNLTVAHRSSIRIFLRPRTTDLQLSFEALVFKLERNTLLLWSSLAYGIQSWKLSILGYALFVIIVIDRKINDVKIIYFIGWKAGRRKVVIIFWWSYYVRHYNYSKFQILNKRDSKNIIKLLWIKFTIWFFNRTS